jgi:hypothetical protein
MGKDSMEVIKARNFKRRPLWIEFRIAPFFLPSSEEFEQKAEEIRDYRPISLAGSI